MTYEVVLYICTIVLLCTMIFIIYENSHYDKKEKNRFYLTYFFIMIAMLAEWSGKALNGGPIWTIVLHKIAICMDYIATPVAGFMVISHVSKRDGMRKLMGICIHINIVLELISVFTGWTYYIDAQNIFHFGPLYTVYVGMYVLTMISVFYEFYVYGRNYKRKNRGSLVMICLLMVLAVFFQEALGFNICYLMLTMVAILLFVHYSEFSQVDSNEDRILQKKLLETDTLTELYSRYAYNNDLKELENASVLPENLVVFSVDINELKQTNDMLGHLAGDELIIGAAECVRAVLQPYGKCYRTGGDEFVALVYMDAAIVYETKLHLREATANWSGSRVKKLSLSIGYAAQCEEKCDTIDELVNIADEKMYESKAQYYMQPGQERNKKKGRRGEFIEQKYKEYTDIISAFASDLTGLYVIDRQRHEVTVYRISATDHRIRMGVPLEREFSVAMQQFVDKHVHPDDRGMMKRSIEMEYIEKQLADKRTYKCHFRTVSDGEVHYHYMKYTRNIAGDDYDKIVISFCPEDSLIGYMNLKKRNDEEAALHRIENESANVHIYEEQFRQAIKNREFVLWYQPKYNPYTDKVIGAEALVRWQKKDGSIISPAEFLPILESNGLISQLDEHVFRLICELQKEWKTQGKPYVPISVNLSRNSMHQSDIVKRYRDIVDEYGITPDMVPIEITESAAIGNREIKPLADAFYEAGFSLHMDDFGSENSSITGLNLLHFDTVKLDRSLIEFIGNEEGNLVLMYAVALAKELGLHVVAEGVETQAQVDYLKDIGCESIQGYYYSKPIDKAEFEKCVMDSFDIQDANFDYQYKLTAADSVVKRAMDRMLQRMPGGFITYQKDDGQILSSNSYMWKLFGCTSEEEFMTYVGGNFKGIVCKEDLERVQRYIEIQIQHDTDEMDYVEYHIVRKDGKKIAVADYGHLDHQPDGDVFYVFISEANEQEDKR